MGLNDGFGLNAGGFGGGSGLNIYNSDGSIPDNTQRLVTTNLLSSSILFGEGSGSFLALGNISSDGLSQLQGQFNNVQLKSFDIDDTTYGILEAVSDNYNATAPIVRVARTDEVRFDYGFAAFDDKTNNRIISNLYMYDIVGDNDGFVIGGMVDYSAFPSLANSKIYAHIHDEPLDPTSKKNGWTTKITSATGDAFSGMFVSAGNSDSTADGKWMYIDDSAFTLWNEGDIVMEFDFINPVYGVNNGTDGFTVNFVNKVTNTNGIRFIVEGNSTIAAANNLTLGFNGNLFTISGNTQINLIESALWGTSAVDAGAIISLKFTGTPTIKHNQAASGTFAPIMLLNGVDFTISKNPTIMQFQFDGTAWQQLAPPSPNAA